MLLEQSIEVLKANRPSFRQTMLGEAIDVAIDTLGKQVLKTVEVRKASIRNLDITSESVIGYDYFCPTCGDELTVPVDTCKCGQKLKW